MNGFILELKEVTKVYATGFRRRPVEALRRVSFALRPGRICALVGPNGSGKSTVLKLIAGLLQPDRGRIDVCGGSPGYAAIRSGIGYLPENPVFPGYVTGRELIGYYGRISGVDGRRLPAAVDAALARVDLFDVADRRLSTYSKGMLQRIGMAQALVHDPTLLLLDEPTSGLDLLASDSFSRLLEALRARGRSILFSTHRISEAERLCDDVVLLRHGAVVTQGPLRGLMGDAPETCLFVRGFDDCRKERVCREFFRKHGMQMTRFDRFSGSLATAYRKAMGKGLSSETDESDEVL